MPGPWSDLPPPDRPKRQPIWRRPREPIITNWRGLVIVAFLILVVPILARWLAQVIGSMASGSGV